MRAEITDRKALSALSPVVVATYLRARGWSAVELDPSLAVFQRLDGAKTLGLDVPLHPDRENSAGISRLPYCRTDWGSMKSIDNAAKTLSYRRQILKAQKEDHVPKGGRSLENPQPQIEKPGTTPSPKQTSFLRFIEDAKDMDFVSFAHMLRAHLRARSLKKRKAILLLALLDAKAGADKLRLRIARNLRQDWANVEGGAPRKTVQLPAIKHLPWVLLPPGQGIGQLERLLANLGEYGKRNLGIKIDHDRLRYAYSLNPCEVYIGQEHLTATTYSCLREPAGFSSRIRQRETLRISSAEIGSIYLRSQSLS